MISLFLSAKHFYSLTKYIYYLLLFSASMCVTTAKCQVKADLLYNKLAASQKEDTNRVNALNALSNYLTYTKTDSAMYYANLSLALAKKIKYNSGQCVAYDMLAAALFELGKTEDAISVYEQEIAISASRANAGHTHISIGMLRDIQGNFPEALKNMDIALKISLEMNNKSDMAVAYTSIGNIKSEMGSYADALKNYFTALKLSEETGDEISVANLYGNLGVLHFNQNNFYEALKYDTVALALQVKAGNKSSIYRLYGNMAQIYKELGKYDKALSCYMAEVNTIHEIAEEYPMAGACLGIGDVYEKQGNYSGALEQFRTALEIYKKVGDKEGIVDACSSIGNLYMATGKPGPARKALDEALAIAKEVGSVEELKKCYLELTMLDSATDNWKDAFMNNRLYNKYKDSLINKENTKKLVEEQMQYDFDKQHFSDSLKVADREKITDLKLRHQRSYTYMGVIGAFLLLLVVAGLSRTYVLQRRANKLKGQLLAQQEDMLYQKDILMKEIHHRVKNNLQVISSLLDLQLENITDDNAQKAMNEGMSRIKSISLIHQQLYQNEDISTIEFSKFAKDLLFQVTYVFKQPGQNITLTNDIPEDYLDIDTAVPLGLILNELMTNSYKYAFGNSNTGYNDGTVRISLTHAAGNYELTYSDSGPGLPAGFDIKRGGSMGLMVVNSLSKELGGNFSYERGSNKFIVSFKDNEERKKMA